MLSLICAPSAYAATIISNVSSFTVLVVPDPLFTVGTLIGKVFNDQNGNGIQDPGEKGIANARVALETGAVITTDEDGKYHLPDLLPGRHLVKIDYNSLPPGSSLTTDNVRLIKETDAMLNKVNFGVLLPEGNTIDSESQTSRPITILIEQDYSAPKRILNMSLMSRQISTSDSSVITPSEAVLNIDTNCSYFIRHWKLDIKKPNGESLFSQDGVGAVPQEINLNGIEDKLESGDYQVSLTLYDEKNNQDEIISVLSVKTRESSHSLNPLKETSVSNSELGRTKLVEGLTSLRLTPGSENSHMVLKGGTVRLQGETDPHASLEIFSRKIPINRDGTYKAEFILPEGNYDIPVVLKEKNGQTVERSEHVRVSDSYLFMVGFGEVELGQLGLKGALESLSSEDKDRFEGRFYVDQRIAYYLKGKIKGKYLITSSLDTDRKKRELFTDLNPDDYYPVYGDASKVDYDATETQDAFYILVEADKSYLKWGNYGTGLTANELANFNRTLHGLKAHYESVSTSSRGEANTLLTVFVAQARQAASHDELRGTGGTLYYLKRGNIVQGSEKVALEVRDEISGNILSRRALAEGQDYDIDFYNGHLIFYRPVFSVADASQTIIGDRILDGNPQYVVADYEYRPEAVANKQSIGARAAHQLSPSLRIGGTYVQEEKDQKDYQLSGLDTKLDLPLNTQITAEYAQSETEGVETFLSSDGGLSFNQVTRAGIERSAGNAYKIEAETNPLGVHLSGYYKHIDRDFSSSGSMAQTGAEKFGLKIDKNFGKENEFRFIHDDSAVLNGGNTASNINRGVEKTKTSTAQLVLHPSEPLRVTTEYRHKEQSGRSTPDVDANQDHAAAEGAYQVNPGTTFVLGGQTTLAGDTNHQAKAGVRQKIGADKYLSVAETVGSQGDATLIDIEQAVGKIFYKLSHAVGSVGTKTSLTESKPVTDNILTYRTYAIEETPQGERTTSNVRGVRSAFSNGVQLLGEDTFGSHLGKAAFGNKWGVGFPLSDRWNMDASFERSHTEDQALGTSREVGRGRLEYIDVGHLKGSSDIELRFDEDTGSKRQILTRHYMQYQLNRDWWFLGRHEYSQTRDIGADTLAARFSKLQTGFAFRPVAYDWLNVLAEYKKLEELSPLSQADADGIAQEMRTIYSIEGAFDIFPQVTLVEKFARRDTDTRISSDLLHSQTYLLANRLQYHLTPQIDIVGELRYLRQRQAKDARYGLLTEVDYKLTDYLSVTGGYNFQRYDSKLANDFNFRADEFYIRLTTLFSELTPEELARRQQEVMKERERRLIHKKAENIFRQDRALTEALDQKLVLARKLYQERKFRESFDLWVEILKVTQDIKRQAETSVKGRFQQEEELKALLSKGNFYLKEGDYPRALSIFEKIVKQAAHLKSSNGA